MTFSDNTSLAEDGSSTPISNSPVNPSFPGSGQALSLSKGQALSAEKGLAALPLWAAALPLWASAHWLWLAIGNSDPVRYQIGTTGQQALVAGRSQNLGQVPFTISYSLIVLDCRAIEKLPDYWWQQLEQMLASGGLLLICCRRDKRLPGRVRAVAPKLYPSAWHVIEPGQEGSWHLRPANSSMRRIALELNPPYSTRVWLARMLRRWLPVRDTNTIDCLPVSHAPVLRAEVSG